jgi:hypothetical protein
MAEREGEMMKKLSDRFMYYSGILASVYPAAVQDLKRVMNLLEAEEQGLLLKLPCKIGADVYSIPSKVNFELNVLSRHKENNRVYHQKITNIVFTENGWYMTGHLDMEYGTGRIFLDKFYKETWFLTKEEAEAKLKELENE